MNTTLLATRLLRSAALPFIAALLCAPPAQAVQSAAREWNEQLLAAIRINLPNPPAHARNLHHVSVAMYDSWAAYDPSAVGYIYNEKILPLPGTPALIEAARHEAISYAAYRVLRARFVTPVPAPAGAAVTSANIDAKLTALGYSVGTAQAAVTNGTTPAELGKRIGQAILTWGASDGFSQTTYPQAYNSAVNPNLLTVTIQDPNNPPPATITIVPRAMSVLGNNGEGPPSQPNMPLGVGFPLIANTAQAYTHDADPNYWQPLALSAQVSQNGIPIPAGVQAFVGVQSLATTPFSLTRTDPVKPWIDPGGPSRLSTPGNPSATDAGYKAGAMDVLRKSAKLNDQTLIDISPGAFGNNPLGTDTGTGFAVNPVTNLPYAPNLVKRGDFARVIAEFWADGPNSETPPGHWHVLANEVSDDPLTVKRIGGVGPVVSDLEWDVKTYFSLAGAVHDAACAVWSLKRYYSGPRPITMIRYMGTTGQSSDNSRPSYNSQGLPLETDVVEEITNDTAAVGGKHENVWNLYTNGYESGLAHLGEIVVYSFPGEGRNNPAAQLPPVAATTLNSVRWMLAKDWLPFQRKTFNTPAFPGYASGHSSFSRASAEVLTLLTGSPSFPGGFHHHTVAANSMQIDLGPSVAVDLQWNTYYDGADQAGQSRRWGGIHPFEDDFSARIIGSQVGKSAYALAQKYWTGTIAAEAMSPQITRLGNGSARVTWRATRGMYHKVQTSPDLIVWTDANTPTLAYDTNGLYTDATPLPGKEFYRIIRTVTP